MLLPDGRVLFIPGNATSIGIYHPVTNSYTTAGATPGASTYYGGVLLPDGRVVMIPFGQAAVGFYLANTPAPAEFCLHPFFNKY